MKRSGVWNVDFRPGRRDWAVWLPTLLGVGVLLMMLILAAHRLVSPPPDRIAVPPAPITPYWQEPAATPPVTDPSAIATVTVTVSPSPSLPAATPEPASTRTASGHPASGRPRTSRPAPAPPPPPVTGRYRVVDSFGDGFIGEVLLSNTTGAPAGWVVALRFPATVGELRTSWVESAPQATQTRRGDTFVWHSGVPVDGGSSVALRFHFARQGTGDRPSSCTVDGRACG